MNRTRVSVVVLAASVLTLTGCGGPTHGVVHDKQFTPAHTVYTTQCLPAGKVTICHPVPLFVGDDYELDVYASADDHGWVEVTAAEYDRYHVGDTYSR